MADAEREMFMFIKHYTLVANKYKYRLILFLLQYLNLLSSLLLSISVRVHAVRSAIYCKPKLFQLYLPQLPSDKEALPPQL